MQGWRRSAAFPGYQLPEWWQFLARAGASDQEVDTGFWNNPMLKQKPGA
jgi:hypothetical protein